MNWHWFRRQPGYRWLQVTVVAIAALTLTVACQPSPETPTPAEGSAAPVASPSVTLNGTGASFPLFLYDRIFSEYRQQVNPNLRVNYQPIGSAAGIQQVLAKTVDFGASDIAMTDGELAQADPEVLLIPMTAGTVAIAYNLPEIGSGLRLTRTALADIFLGKLTRWNDPEIAAANPDRVLPDLPITLVHRSDGSGTTAVLTAHLSAISPEWEKKVGAGLNVSWPAGVGIKANAGVSAQIQQAAGAIGYVEYSYAQKLGFPIAALENLAGNFVEPSPETGANGLKEIEPPENLRAFVADPTGTAAYPIVTYSWILAYRTYSDAAKGESLKALLKWGLTEGQQFSESLGYIPLPADMVTAAMTIADRIQTR